MQLLWVLGGRFMIINVSMQAKEAEMSRLFIYPFYVRDRVEGLR